MGLFNFRKKTKVRRNIAFEQEYSKLTDELQKQDEQIERINRAEIQYKDDINSLIQFWEDIWETEGLLSVGSAKTFRLPDLYIEAKRYNDALKILQKIDNPAYKDKKEAYMQKVMKKTARP